MVVAREAPAVERVVHSSVDEAPSLASAPAAIPARVEPVPATPEAPELASSALLSAPPGLAGRVVDLDGHGVADLEVVFEAGILESGPLSRIDMRRARRLMRTFHAVPTSRSDHSDNCSGWPGPGAVPALPRPRLPIDWRHLQFPQTCRDRHPCGPHPWQQAAYETEYE